MARTKPPVDMWIDPREIVASILDDMALGEENAPRAYRMLGEFTRLLGTMPELYQHSEEVPVKNSVFPFPKGMLAVYAIHLCFADGRVEEAIYGSNNASGPYLPQGGCDTCTYWKDIPGLPVVQMDTVAGNFFMPYGDSTVSSAIVIYQGPKLNEEGVPMIPFQASLAAKAYLEWRLAKRQRSLLGPSVVSSAEIERLEAGFLRYLAAARATIKSPSRIHMIEWARRNATRLPYTSFPARRKK